MNYRLFYVLLVPVLLAAGGCATEIDPMDDGGKIKYPYQAPPEQRARIMTGVNKLYLGMPEADVVKLLGEAEERNTLYYNSENFENRKVDGFVLVYLLQRVTPFGGMTQRKEQSFRLEFGKEGRLKKVEAIEVPGVPMKFLPR